MFPIRSSIVQLHGAAYSSQGGRKENQDDLGFVDTPLGFLFVVCDGMGGGPGGKTASYLAKTTIARAFGSYSPQMPVDKAFRNAVAVAQEVITAKANETPSLRGMGSTFVAVLINEHSAVVAHSGDSRCYRLQGKDILYRTCDHSLVADLVRKKTLTEEQARTSPRSNVITRGLGCVKNNTPDIKELPYRKGDRFVLCTDGVWGIMPHDELINRLTAQSEEHLIVSSLGSYIDTIGFQKGGNHDNHSLALIVMDCDSRMKDKWKIAFPSPSALTSQLSAKKVTLVGIAIVLAAVIVVCVKNISPEPKDDEGPQADTPLSSLGYGGFGGNAGGEGTPTAPLPKIEDKTDGPLNVPDTLTNIAELVEGEGMEVGEGKKEEEKDVKKEDNSDNDNLQVMCNKLINRLDSAKSYAGNSVDDAIKKKEELLNKAIMFAKQISDQLTDDSNIKNRASGIAGYVERQKGPMLTVMQDAKTGKYVSCPGAVDLINKAEEKAKELQRQIKEQTEKQETQQ